MFLYRLRFLLPLISLATLAAAGLVAAWVATAPDPQCKIPGAKVANATASAAAGGDSETLELETFESIFQRQFQRPLFDPPPPPPPPVKEKPPPPKPAVKLLATMPEPNGGGHAMFSVNNSQIVKGVGAEIDDGKTVIEIVEITNNSVVVLQGERSITLELAK